MRKARISGTTQQTIEGSPEKCHSNNPFLKAERNTGIKNPATVTPECNYCHRFAIDSEFQLLIKPKSR